MQVPLANAHCHYTAGLPNAPAPLPSALLATSDATTCMQYLLDTLDISPLSAAGAFELYFETPVPPLGYTTVILSPGNATRTRKTETEQSLVEEQHAYAPQKTIVPLPEGLLEESCALCKAAHALRKQSASTSRNRLESSSSRLSVDDTAQQRLGDSDSDNGGSSGCVALENAHLKVMFDEVTGRIVGVLQKGSGKWVGVAIELVYWESKQEEPFGGAYIMRPGVQVRANSVGFLENLLLQS